MHGNRFTPKAKKKQDVSLQITSMADIFTILLVFLLKSYASGEAAVPPSSAIVLPTAKGSAPIAETLRMEISSDAVLVGGKRVVSLRNFRLDGEAAAELQTLKAAIGQERGRQLASTGVTGTNPEEGGGLHSKLDTRVTMLIDQKVPYQTLKKIMVAAAAQGYTDFKLAVVKVDE